MTYRMTFNFRFFLLVERSSVNLYSYEGRLVSSPRWAAMQPETMNEKSISLSDDTLAARDQNDPKGEESYKDKIAIFFFIKLN